jgi:hypothetical protein
MVKCITLAKNRIIATLPSRDGPGLAGLHFKNNTHIAIDELQDDERLALLSGRRA